MGEEVNFGDCRGEIGLRRPILLYSLEEVNSSKKYKNIIYNLNIIIMKFLTPY